MLIDEKGRLFGKVSVVDILVVLFIVGAVAGAYYKFFIAERGGAAAQFDTLQYQVITVSGVRQPSVDAVKEGAEVFDGETGGYIGKVIQKDISPAKSFIKKTDGTYAEARMPDKFDVIITVEVTGVENDHGFFANGNIEIKRGSDLKFKTQMIMLETRVVDVRRIKNEE